MASGVSRKVFGRHSMTGGFKEERATTESLDMEQHKRYLIEHGEDLPEVRNWQWTPRQTP